jgi:hypothetical protein
LRRAVSSFTVEVRRRPRLAITSNPHVQSSETKSPQAGFDRESHRVAAAAFEARKVDPSPVDVASSPGAEFFRASSPRSRYVVRSETPHQPRQSLTLLRGRQSGGIKHPNRRGTRDSPPPRMRRWLTDCRPSLVNRPTCNQMKGQAFRQGSRRPSKVKSSETPAVWRWAQRQDEETRSRSLAMTSGSGICLASSDPR